MVVETFYVPSESMLPSLLIGDHVFVSKFSFGARVPVLGWRLPATRAEGCGIQLECRAAGRHRPDGDPIAELGSFASANHLSLEASPRDDGLDASLWLPS